MTYKSIFKGHLEFGSPKSYDKVLKMYQHRVENYYKSDVLLNEEDIFDEASSSLRVPRHITQGSEKSWKNTVSLMEYVAQFAVAGSFGAWMTNEGKVMHHGFVEPKSERAAVQAFLKGRKLSEEEGREDDAMKALNRAIEKYERHGQAYERRGYVNYLLQNYDDAFADYSQSIELAPTNPEAYFGRGQIRVIREDMKGAIVDFGMAIKQSIPLQSINLTARRLKSELHIELKEFQQALADLRFLTKRKFKPDNPCYIWRRSMFFNYGRVLLETGKVEEAVETFDAALQIEVGAGDIQDAEIFLLRGMARQKASKKGFLKDWKEAEKLEV